MRARSLAPDVRFIALRNPEPTARSEQQTVSESVRQAHCATALIDAECCSVPYEASLLATSSPLVYQRQARIGDQDPVVPRIVELA